WRAAPQSLWKPRSPTRMTALTALYYSTNRHPFRNLHRSRSWARLLSASGWSAGSVVAGACKETRQRVAGSGGAFGAPLFLRPSLYAPPAVLGLSREAQMPAMPRGQRPYSLVTLRDRAIYELYMATPATISWIAMMQVQDFYRIDGRSWVRTATDGLEHTEPVARSLERCLDEYVAPARIGHDAAGLFFRCLRAD